MRPAFLEKDAEKQKELYQKFLTDSVVPHAAIVEKHLEKNNTGFLVGQEVMSFLPIQVLIIDLIINIMSIFDGV